MHRNSLLHTEVETTVLGENVKSIKIKSNLQKTKYLKFFLLTKLFLVTSCLTAPL